jgi:hypothetical protein
MARGIQGGRRWLQATALWADHHRNGCKAILGVARPQGIEGSGMAGQGKTLGRQWIPLAIRDCEGEYED